MLGCRLPLHGLISIARYHALTQARSSPEDLHRERQRPEIKIGNIMPTAGRPRPMVIGDEKAFRRRDQCRGGVNGRNINFFPTDDALKPAQGDRHAAKLGESDEFLFMLSIPLARREIRRS